MVNVITKQSQMILAELPATQFGVYNGDRGFCVFDRVGLMPSRSTHHLEAIGRRDGFSNIRSFNPLFHGKKGKMTSKNEETVNNSDLYGVSSITRTSSQSMESLGRYKLANPDGIAVAGGPDPTARAEEWLTKGNADIVVMGEGEKTFSELLERLTKTTTELDDIDGLAFKRGNNIVITNPRELMTQDELSNLPLPFYDDVVRSKASVGALETTRGCPHACKFCGVTKFYGEKYRTKSEGYAIKGLENVRDIGSSTFFTDDNFIGNPKRAIRLLERIAEEGLGGNICAQVTIRVAENQELLDALKKVGANFLHIGVESLNDETLKAFGKPSNAEQNKRNLKILADQGFWIHTMYMPGGDGDTPESLRENFEWLKKNSDSIQFMPPTALPGTPFHDEMASDGRILREDKPYLYDVQHVVIRPKHFTPFELQTTINGMYKEFYSPTEFAKREWRLKGMKKKWINTKIAAYVIGGNVINRALYGPQEVEHLDFLGKLDSKK